MVTMNPKKKYLIGFIVITLLVISTLLISVVATPDPLYFLTQSEKEWLEKNNNQIEILHIQNPAWPPMYFKDHAGKRTGILVDFIHEIINRLGIQPKPRYFDSVPELHAYMKTGRNFFAGGVAWSKGLSPYVNFGDTVYNIPWVVITRKDATYPNLDSLAGRPVGVPSVPDVVEFMEEYYPAMEMIELKPDAVALLRGVSNGEYEAVIFDQAIASYFMQEQGFISLKITGDTGLVNKPRVATSIKDPILANILGKAVAEIPEKRKHAILNNYFHFSEDQPFNWTFLLWGAVFALIAFSAIVFWNFTLRVKVRARTSALNQELQERHKTEAELRESEIRFRSLHNNVPVGIFRSTPEGRFLSVNPTLINRLGYSTEAELMAIPVPDLYVDVAERYRMLDELENNGVVLASEIRLKHKDRTILTLSLNAMPIYDNEGKLMHIDGMVEDITERKQIESELHDREKELDSIIKNTPDIIYRLNADGNISFISDAISRYGYRPHELIGRKIKEIVHPADRPKLQRVNERRRGDRATKGLEVKLLTKDKPTVQLESMADEIKVDRTFLIDAEGLYHSEGSESVFIGTQGIARDITERILHEREREAMSKRFAQSQKMEAIGTLAGGIAHDFNNILSGIIGFSELALEPKSNLDPETRHYISNVLVSGNRAKNLVQQILRFSRQDSDAMQITRIKPIIKELIKLLQASFPSTIEIIHSITAQNDRVYANSTQIHQVIMNLCTNANHAMRGKSGKLTINVENITIHQPRIFQALQIPPGNYIRLIVADEGYGIPEGIMDKIFEPYFTTKDVDEGTGLGLAVTLGIMKNCRGLLEVESRPGEGTTFSVYWPLNETGEEKLSKTTGSVPIGNGQKLLIVDDESFFLEVIKTYLENLNYTVCAYQGSLEVLDIIRRNPNDFDLIITDQTMPKMTGIQLVSEIRAVNSIVPIVLCTGFSEVVSEETAANCGISKYLMKPVNNEDLAITVNQLLNGRRKL